MRAPRSVATSCDGWLCHSLWLAGIAGSALLTLLGALDIGGSPPAWTIFLGQGAGWVVWFAWQGWLFSAHRARYRRDDPRCGYGRALRRDIVPGAAFAIFQMLGPAAWGLRATGGALPHPPAWLGGAGFVCLAGGIVLLTVGVRTLGLAGASFRYEYADSTPTLVQWGIYAHLRHPLFLGAVAVSIGVSLFFALSSGWAVGIALVNAATIPVYARIEDARLIAIFGEPYRAYRAAVGGFVPKFVWRIPNDSPSLLPPGADGPG